MSTNIHVYFDFDWEGPTEADRVLAKLGSSGSACLALEEYWKRSDPTGKSVAAWHLARKDSRESVDELVLRAPGAIVLTIRHRLARLQTGGRWRGFLSIPELHALHLRSFREVGKSLGASQMVLVSSMDDDSLLDLFLEGATVAECAAKLQSELGQPEVDVDTVRQEVVDACDRGVPSVWYWERFAMD